MTFTREELQQRRVGVVVLDACVPRRYARRMTNQSIQFIGDALVEDVRKDPNFMNDLAHYVAQKLLGVLAPASAPAVHAAAPTAPAPRKRRARNKKSDGPPTAGQIAAQKAWATRRANAAAAAATNHDTASVVSQVGA